MMEDYIEFNYGIYGQDKNATITKIFAKDAHGAVIMSDAVNIDSRKDSIKWKNSIDEVANFIDGGKLPCILVENNIDLLPYEEKDELELQRLSEKYGFIGTFRVSSNTGKNVNEAMDFLIKNIIKRKDDFEDKNLEIKDKKLIISEIDINSDKNKNRKKDTCILL